MKKTHSLTVVFFFIDNENLLAHHLVLTEVQEVINKKKKWTQNKMIHCSCKLKL